MQYALLFYLQDEAQPECLPEQERAAFAAEMGGLTEAMRQAGILRGQQRLHMPEAATTLRVSDGKTLVVDGPFAETKESLAGFFVVECGDMDEALSWAARVPIARLGSIEIRPLRPCG